MSRSFYLSVRVLPSAVQGQVAIGYLLARAADSIADTSLIPAAERRERLATLRQAWLDWDATMPPIAPDASVSLGYSAADMPQRQSNRARRSAMAAGRTDTAKA